ncbi:SusE domain-containing protein [Flavobacterium sp. KACC 22763]|uniref:SusE domain-containing protein n=1 Tax=Flavobacterium sp. KACC 22763 TaxID=3025668 RepID=UPI00236629F8|nr:SusE domain-containing protein [Flavobacterium sp. KACC 22763]WDF66156.1 SusE domain-containing protein [Flavobacterium sp. KACC 22763]
MKNIYKILAALIAILIVSCNADDVENRPVITEGIAPVLLTPQSNFNIVLENANATSLATTFVWNEAHYEGTETVINYTIEVAKAGTDFKNPTIASVTTATFKSFTVEELNAVALNAGLTSFVEGKLDVRIRSTVGAVNALPQTSNFYTITVTPYPAWPNWGIIGSATAATTGGDGWTADADLNYNSASKKYSITMDLAAGEIKFRLDDDWATNYGDNGSDGTLDAGGTNIPIVTAGNYTIVVDFTAKTYTVTKNY